MKPILFLMLTLSAAITQEPTITIKGLGNMGYVSNNKDSIYIKGLENTVDIEFPSAKDSIIYQLKGYETTWNKSALPKIRYTNLIGGEYQINYKLGTRSKLKIIHISIEEAIWQKWWFFPMIALYVLLIIGVVQYFFMQYNFRQKMKIQQIRNKISADLHDEVGSNLSSIAIYTQVLKKRLKDSELLPILDKITLNSKDTVTLMRDTVWAINPINDLPEKLFNRIEDYARGVLSEQNISYDQVLVVDLDKIRLDMEDRKNLYLILKEGINNIAKHSEATKASLEVFEKSNKILFTLKDNGVGFVPMKKTDGNGLRNFTERANYSNFELKIESELGHGCCLIIGINH